MSDTGVMGRMLAVTPPIDFVNHLNIPTVSPQRKKFTLIVLQLISFIENSEIPNFLYGVILTKQYHPKK